MDSPATDEQHSQEQGRSATGNRNELSVEDKEKIARAKKSVAEGKAESILIYLSNGDFKRVGKKNKSNEVRVTKWSLEQLEEFRVWHETRMNELGYPPPLQQELRTGREQFLGAVLP